MFSVLCLLLSVLWFVILIQISVSVFSFAFSRASQHAHVTSNKQQLTLFLKTELNWSEPSSAKAATGRAGSSSRSRSSSSRGSDGRSSEARALGPQSRRHKDGVRCLHEAYTKQALLPHEVAEDNDGDDAALLLLFLLLLLLLLPLAARQWNRKFSTQLKLLHAHTHTYTGTLAYAYTGEERRLSPLMSAPNVVLWFLSRRRVLLRLRLRLL